MSVKLLTEQHLEFLSLKGGCTGSSEYIHVKMHYCWKSHVMTQMCIIFFVYNHFRISDRIFCIGLHNTTNIQHCAVFFCKEQLWLWIFSIDWKVYLQPSRTLLLFSVSYQIPKPFRGLNRVFHTQKYYKSN